MSDEELCRKIAEVWVANGGDADGIAWCYSKLVQAVRVEMEKQTEKRHDD